MSVSVFPICRDSRPSRSAVISESGVGLPYLMRIGIYFLSSPCSQASMTSASSSTTPLRFTPSSRNRCASSSPQSRLTGRITLRAGTYITPAGTISRPYSFSPSRPRANRYSSI